MKGLGLFFLDVPVSYSAADGRDTSDLVDCNVGPGFWIGRSGEDRSSREILASQDLGWLRDIEGISDSLESRTRIFGGLTRDPFRHG